jgi:molybdenum cofactor cytidylyltransferase
MSDVDAILLAAGLSRRMGAPNKLLLDWGGVPIIRHVARTYLGAIGPNVTVITGHQDVEVRKALQGLPLRFHHNPNYAEGQQTSVTAGLTLDTTAQATLIGLGDQPLLSSQDLRDLMQAHLADPGKISIPFHDGRRGNPTVLPALLRPRVLADRAQPGCKRFIRANPELVQRHALPAPGFYTDIDTPEAYAEHAKGVHEDVSV